MSILIKGIEMPKENDELRLFIHPNGQVIILHRTYFDETEAIPVPPHGDLIDRRELIKSDHQHYEYLSDEFYVTVRDIEYAPTIIPADGKSANVYTREENK